MIPWEREDEEEIPPMSSRQEAAWAVAFALWIAVAIGLVFVAFIVSPP